MSEEQKPDTTEAIDTQLLHDAVAAVLIGDCAHGKFPDNEAPCEAYAAIAAYDGELKRLGYELIRVRGDDGEPLLAASKDAAAHLIEMGVQTYKQAMAESGFEPVKPVTLPADFTDIGASDLVRYLLSRGLPIEVES